MMRFPIHSVIAACIIPNWNPFFSFPTKKLDGWKLIVKLQILPRRIQDMAKIANNIITEGLSGSLGGRLVFRNGKAGQTIVAVKRRSDPDQEFNPAQLAHQEAFRQAAAYAKVARVEEVYVAKAEGTTKSAYNVAMADWFNKPQIPELDLNDWNGQAGQSIRVKATDDVQVTRVSVMITDGNGTLLEQGNASQDEGQWWVYVTTVPTNGSRRLKITAHDRPGNTAQTTWQN
jgi:hypothetical protein